MKIKYIDDILDGEDKKELPGDAIIYFQSSKRFGPLINISVTENFEGIEVIEIRCDTSLIIESIAGNQLWIRPRLRT